MAIRVISDTPVMGDNGELLHIKTLAGPSTETKPTAGLASGSVFLETDTCSAALFDEATGWTNAE